MYVSHLRKSILVLLWCGMCLSSGCETSRNLKTSFAPIDATIPTPGPSYLEPAKAALSDGGWETSPTILNSISPETAIDYNNVQYQNITLEECIRRALSESEVFRELGGAIVNQTSSVQTALDPALRFTDPNSGEDAALSEFDANFESSLFFENNDRPFNNTSTGENGLFKQDLITSQTGFTKLAATGTQFTSRTSVNYDANNQFNNRFGSTWEAIIDSGFRHPLLQGSGSLFNRIAGASRVPGQYNGILIARTNTEISLADFEDSVREYVSNVENAYWDLYYAYRELEAQTAARDAALIVVERTVELRLAEKIGQLEVASAEEQLLRFESSIIESMEGRLIEGTRANSGTSGGTFRRTVGVRTAERRLRYLMGMTITDGTLVKPSEQPIKAALAFDWQQTMQTALLKRPETRRQQWLVKQRELELTAARNFLQPRLDLVGNYRFRGLGKHLTGGSVTLEDDINSGGTSAAFSDLSSGNFQEVQFGAELSLPVGFRQANAAVRNAELSIQRERALLKELERKIVLDLSNVIAESRRAFNAMQAAEKRFNAAVEYRTQAAERVKNGRSQYDVLLEAQRRILEAQLQFINAESEYAIAIKNVHFERATFLEYHGIALSESKSDAQAYSDFAGRRIRMTKEINYVVHDSRISQTAAVLADSAPSCQICGQATCICESSVADNRLAAPPVASIANSSMTETDKPLMANGLGKSHDYAPNTLPMTTGSSTAQPPSPVAPASPVVVQPTEQALPANGLGKPHVFQPSTLPAPTAKAQMQARIPVEQTFEPLPSFESNRRVDLTPTDGPVVTKPATDSIAPVEPVAPPLPATPRQPAKPAASIQPTTPVKPAVPKGVDSSRLPTQTVVGSFEEQPVPVSQPVKTASNASSRRTQK